MEAVLFFAFLVFALIAYGCGRVLASRESGTPEKMIVLLALIAACYAYSYLISTAIERATP